MCVFVDLGRVTEMNGLRAEHGWAAGRDAYVTCIQARKACRQAWQSIESIHDYILFVGSCTTAANRALTYRFMVAATSALAPNAAQLAAAPVAWQAPFNLLPAHAVRRKPCSHCCGRLAKPRHALTHCGPHSVTSLRYLAAPHLTAAHHT